MEKDKEPLINEDDLKTVINSLVDSLTMEQKQTEPVLHFKYPDPPQPLSAVQLLDWAEQMGGYFLRHATTYEEAHRGRACSVDRARSQWLKPECEKMLDYLNSVAMLNNKDE